MTIEEIEAIPGNCFPMAMAQARRIAAEKPNAEVRIVHGLPIGRGADNDGLRFWHAWVEVTVSMPIPDEMPPEVQAQFRTAYPTGIRIETVIDRSNGLEIEGMPRGVFYNTGNLDEDHVWRFTLDEAAEMIESTTHYGPWVDHWKEMEEV